MDDLSFSRATPGSHGSLRHHLLPNGGLLLPDEPEPAPRPRAPLAQVLLVGDRDQLAGPVGEVLNHMGYATEYAATGAEALRRLAEARTAPRPDAVALGTQLPDMAGFEFCQRLRATDRTTGQPAVVMFSARLGDTFDRIVGLESGADDFMALPCHPRELLARLQGILRRRRHDGTVPVRQEPGAPLRFGSLEIDPERRRATLDGTEVALTAYRFSLLLTLARRAGQAMTRDQIIATTTGWKPEQLGRGLDVQIGRIRAVIERMPHRPRRIVTVRGTGYMFARSQD